MTTTSHHRRSTTDVTEYGGAPGVIVFAATMMILVGFFHAVQGLVALVNDDFFVVGEEYVLEFDLTGWGWAHLILGVAAAVAGGFLVVGSTVARTVAVIVASISILASFAWIPFYPFWSIAVIALGVFVIWAVTTRGGDVVET